MATPATNGPATPRGRVIILGDSLTAGYGLDAAQAYPALLQAKVDAAGLPYTIVNAGVSGDTTAGGLRRLDWVLSGGAEVLVIALGANDGLRGVPPAETAHNLNAIIAGARQKISALKIIVAGMQMPASMGVTFTGQFREIFPQVASKNQARLVPFLLDHVGGIPTLNQDDGVHPNVAGQKILAENVWPILQKVLTGAARGKQ